MELCGRSCESCTWKERLNCPGCQAGPGRSICGDCEIAVCCRGKGHTACETCNFLSSCNLQRGRDGQPEHRLRRLEAERERRARLGTNAPLLGKWLWPLFWMVIPGMIGNVMSNESVTALFPAVGTVGEVLGILVSLVYGVFLWQLRTVSRGYRTAALCGFAGVGFGGLMLVLGMSQENALWWLLALPMLAVEFFGMYREYNAHADVLAGLDDDLSEKWRKLWKWMIGLYLGLFACLLVALLSAVLGLLVMLADVIGLAVVGILRLVYLYRTAKLFREYHLEALPEVTE